MHTKTSSKESLAKVESNAGHVDLAPDGGWGWMVCLASFFANFILDGTMFSFGVLLLELLDFFKDSKFNTSIVGSAQVGTSMMMGPLVSLLLNRYSYRQVTIAGAILTTVSFVISIFSPNIGILILTYGFLGGIGLSMMFITSVVVVGMYFTKKRALATGIATSGSGLGIFVYSYMIEQLNEVYDWRGTILIVAGLVANCAVCGAVFRPLYARYVRNFNESQRSPSFDDVSGFNKEVFESDKDTQSFPYQPINEINGGLTPQIQKKLISKRLSKSHDDLKLETAGLLGRRLYQSSVQINTIHTPKYPDSRKMCIHPLMKKDIYYSGSIMKLSESKQHGDTGSFVSSLIQTDTSSDNGERSTPLCSKLSRVFDFSLLKDSMFLFLLVMFVLWTVQTIPLMYVPDLAVSRGISKRDAALIVSVIGGANTVGRLTGGIIVDILHVRSLVVNTLSLFVAATVSFVLPFCESFVLFGICGAVFGFCMACNVSLRTIILADVLGIEKLTVSFGVVALFQGIAFAAFAPIAGRLYDVTLSYIPPFALAGSAYFISGMASLVVLIRHWRKTTVSVSTNVQMNNDIPNHDVL